MALILVVRVLGRERLDEARPDDRIRRGLHRDGAPVAAAVPARVWNRPVPRARALVGPALLYLFLPIFIVVLFSFNDPRGRFNHLGGLTLDHWKDPFGVEGLAVANSLEIAVISTAIARAGHRHGAGAGALPLPRPGTVDMFVPAAGLARGRARRGAAGAVLTMNVATDSRRSSSRT